MGFSINVKSSGDKNYPTLPQVNFCLGNDRVLKVGAIIALYTLFQKTKEKFQKFCLLFAEVSKILRKNAKFSPNSA